MDPDGQITPFGQRLLGQDYLRRPILTLPRSASPIPSSYLPGLAVQAACGAHA